MLMYMVFQLIQDIKDIKDINDTSNIQKFLINKHDTKGTISF